MDIDNASRLCVKNSTIEWLACSGCGRLQEDESAWWRAAIVLAVSLLALPSNLLVIAVVHQTPALRNNQGVYMVSLAISDLGAGIWFLLFCFRYAVTGYGPTSRIELDAGAWFYYLLLTMTLCTTLGIGLDKLHQIRWPYSYDRVMTRKRVSGIVIGMWLGIGLLSTLPTRIFPISGYYYEFTASSLMFNTKSCRGQNQVDSSLFIARIAIILFMVIMLVVGYGSILVISRKHVRQMRNMQETAMLPISAPTAANDNEDAQGEARAAKKQLRRSRRRASLRGWITNACVVLGFLVCWLPFFIYKIAIASKASSSTETLQFCIVWFTMTNTSINAAIYGGTYKPFKKGVRRFFRRLANKPLADTSDLFSARLNTAA